MYKYKVTDSYIDGELVNQPQVEVGYRDGWYYSEERLSYMLPNGEFKYQISDGGELVEIPFDMVAYEKPFLLERIKKMVSNVISEYDWKALRHLEQKDLINKGLLQVTSLSGEEYISILKIKQMYRELSGLAEVVVNNVKTEQEINDIKKLLGNDFSYVPFVETFFEELKTKLDLIEES